jgi:hypothetical protein
VLTQSALHTSDSTSEPEGQDLGTEHQNVMASKGRGCGKCRRGRGKNQASNQGKTNCQICGKPNHDVVGCWYRFDPQAMKQNSRGYNAGSPPRPQNFNPFMHPSAHFVVPQPYAFMANMEATSSGAWYPDSGVSHHLTYNPNNLAYCVP